MTILVDLENTWRFFIIGVCILWVQLYINYIFFFSFEELISFQIIKRNLLFAIRSIFFDCYFKAIIAFLQVVEPYVR